MKQGGVLMLMIAGGLLAEAGAFEMPKVEVTPMPHHEVVLTVDGIEKVRWHHGQDMPRPFFYPFNGPSGVSLTRMGHPGAPDHDHHCSIWFAHVDVNGTNFWGNSSGAVIRQKQWLAYQDGEEEGILAVRLGWYDAEGKELMEQDLFTALRQLAAGEQELEIQSTFRPPLGQERVTLGKTNFGLLAVRVAKSLSEHFGGGRLTSSEGAVGEPAIFGQPARWIDYSGPVVVGTGRSRKAVEEGITFIDHASNPRHPTRWHVRADGWMGASFCLEDSWEIPTENPLTLRYLLHAHAGIYDETKATSRAEAFNQRPPLQLKKAQNHRHFKVQRP
jgi:hypothetical protein